MLTLETLRSQYKDAILAIAAQHHVDNVRVFGSVAHGTASEHSDLDLLVHAGEGCSLIDLCAMQRKISELFDGIKIDLLSEGEIRDELKPFIINEATKL
jgi:uncharacterized protein